MPTAFITGITGQDGSFLSEFLLAKDYQVVGLVSGNFNIGYQNIDRIKDKLILEEGDLLDQKSLEKILDTHPPDEIYNLAGMTFIPPSWEKPTLTLDVNTLGVTRLLELVVQKHQQARFYQASSSKIFGDPEVAPQNETTPIAPQDPYSVSKAAAHRLVGVIRKHFDIFAVSGIMFNHESERRGPEFVTRKITISAVKIKAGRQAKLELGDLDAVQDWGYAPDYVQAMWLMLTNDTPDDYVIATGVHHSVADICQIAFSHLGLDYQDYVTIDPSFIRKEKITSPKGDASKAKKILGWQPQVSFEQMIIKMVEHDQQLLTAGQLP